MRGTRVIFWSTGQLVIPVARMRDARVVAYDNMGGLVLAARSGDARGRDEEMGLGLALILILALVLRLPLRRSFSR